MSRYCYNFFYTFTIDFRLFGITSVSIQQSCVEMCFRFHCPNLQFSIQLQHFASRRFRRFSVRSMRLRTLLSISCMRVIICVSLNKDMQSWIHHQHIVSNHPSKRVIGNCNWELKASKCCLLFVGMVRGWLTIFLSN